MNAEPGNISVAIIADNFPRDASRHHKLGSLHAMKFIERIFSENFPNPIFTRHVWPPVYTGDCPQAAKADSTIYFGKHTPGLQRGAIMAHRQILENFIDINRDIPANMSSYESPKIIIFENDAMEIDPMAPNLAYQSVANMTSQIHYLGHCYDRYPGVSPPECAHAYALTVEGARIILENIDWCAHRNGGSYDQQLKAFGSKGLLKWSAVTASSPFGLSDNYIQGKSLVEGFTIEFGSQAGGLFYQILYDNYSQEIEGSLYKLKWPTKSVYLFQNGTYHEFQDVKTFLALGYNFDDVILIPGWQLKRSIGTVLPNNFRK